MIEFYPGNNFTGTFTGTASLWSHHFAENQQDKIGAGGGTRTHTTFYSPRILSPVRLPFRHTGKKGNANRTSRQMKVSIFRNAANFFILGD